MNKRFKDLLFPPLVVLAVMGLLVAYAVLLSRRTADQELSQSIDAQVAVIETLVFDRLNAVEENLRAGAGLFEVNDQITQADWTNFIEATAILDRFEGAQGIGYSKKVTQNNLEEFLTTAKQDFGSEFEISPEGNRQQYSVVTLLAPFDITNVQVIGFDMFSEPKRRNAMMSARDTGNVFISQAVSLEADKDISEQLGFLMYAPQYRTLPESPTIEDRRQALEGYVYAIFKAQTFIDNSIDSLEISPSFDLVVYDGQVEQQNIIFTRDRIADETPDRDIIEVNRNLLLNGASWTMNYSFDRDDLLSVSTQNNAANIGFIGMLSALGVSYITFLLLYQKASALRLSKEREINEAKDSLLSIASHQLRTPATGVKQYLGMVLQGFAGDISPSQADLLKKAYESNERQLETINNVLYLARAESGRIVLSINKVELKSLIESVIDELSTTIESENHRVKLRLPKRRLYIEADDHMLRMIVENLVTNAIKYTPNGGKIEVSLQALKNRVRITVKDNGVGIKQEDQDKIFKQFSRVPNKLSKSVSGTGIGLYLAHRLIELHQGSIKLHSEEGVGSTFTVELPKKSEGSVK